MNNWTPDYKTGQKVWVNVSGRKIRGVIVRHHASLPAWIVRTKRSKVNLAYMYQEVSAA